LDTAGKITSYKALFEDYLNSYINRFGNSGGLNIACTYSLSAGGKRLRPVIVMLAADACGGSPALTLPAGLAIEMIHTFSLIHDDLPAIDNDDLRRGKPTCHKTFGEATAILAGDALIFEAFSLVAGSSLPDDAISDVTRAIADSCGLDGLIKGEYDDIMAEKKAINLKGITDIYLRKTSRLFELSTYTGARVACATNDILNMMKIYGRHLGLAFQAIDDILDVTSDSGKLGKTAGKDMLQEKATIVKVLGIDGARKWAQEQTELALTAVTGLNACHLENIALDMLKRVN
jgi:geranylgeranyl diphosphate synthase, type II